MFKHNKKKKTNEQFENDDLNENSNDCLDDEFIDEYEDDFFDNEDDDIFGDSAKNIDEELAEKKKEYYVKGEDLANEIRKYQESKKNSPDRKGCGLRRASE